jgi:AcrR family transcriptional regulator
MPAAQTSERAHRIVDTAVELAEQSAWESVRLHQVAEALGIGLDDVRRCFREKDELIDAWFERADDAVLQLSDSGELAPLSPRERLIRLIMVWLDALEAHRQVSRQMIQSKLEPGHLHIQIPALMRVSRTVQWMREGAGLEDAGVMRAVVETATTALYLAAFASWMGEDTAGSPRTRRLLDGLLAQAEAFMQACPGRSGKAGEKSIPRAL